VTLEKADWDRRYNLPDFEMFVVVSSNGSRERTHGDGAPREKLREGMRYRALISEIGRLWQRGTYSRELVIDMGVEWARENFDLTRQVFNETLVRREIAHLIDSYPPGDPWWQKPGNPPRNTPTQGLARQSSSNPWLLAIGMDVFLQGEDEAVEFLYSPVIARETIAEIFSPRGLGKSLWATFCAVSMAKNGLKVMLIDRDNPRSVVRRRLRDFGATGKLANLKVLSRENAPPLTNARAWAEFPYADYDVVILDSLDSAAEGVGEQDSTKPSLALAPLLNIARRENGPGVLLLGNTIKTAAHSRGSGVIEDRADIVFEVRDATNFHPTGKKPWIEELPAAEAGAWAGRSSRRKRLSQYRLAFIATKYRIAEEPEPFIVEINLDTDPWTVRDVTDLVDQEGAEARIKAAEEKAAAVSRAVETLKAEMLRREVSGEPIILKTQAEEFLTKAGHKRKLAREAIDSPVFEVTGSSGKGRPRVVRMASKKNSDGRNSTPTEPAPDAASDSGDFCRPHPEHTAEIPPNETDYPRGSQNTPIFAEPTLFTPPSSEDDGVVEEGSEDDDSEVIL
jgi:hypothetical protein